MKKKWLIAMVVVALAAAGAGYYYYYQAQNQVPLAVPVTVVSTTPAQTKNIPITTKALGTIIAPQSATLQSEQSGTITGIYFKSGQQVKVGDLLITLDNAQQKAAYLKAQAAYLQTKEQYHRYTLLAKQPGTVVSQSDYDQVVSTYKQALADLNQARENLAETRIIAPFNGTLGTTALAIGSLVQVGSNLVPIVNRQNLVVEYVLPETNYAYAKLGQTVEMKTDVYPKQVFDATVSYISPQIDPVNRTFTLRAQFKNSDNKLSPGMLMSITHVLAPEHEVLAVPAISLIPEVSGYGVYVVVNNKVTEAFISVGQQFDQWVEVLGGLTAGQQVISAGQQKVKPGITVKVVQS